MWGLLGNRLVPQPFNLLMNTFVESDGTLIIRDPTSKSGDKITMIARMPLIVSRIENVKNVVISF